MPFFSPYPSFSNPGASVALGERSRQTLGVIRFNIVFSLAVKALFLVLAIFGMTSLWLAILADTGATLLVVMNALRLLQPRAHQ